MNAHCALLERRRRQTSLAAKHAVQGGIYQKKAALHATPAGMPSLERWSASTVQSATLMLAQALALPAVQEHALTF